MSIRNKSLIPFIVISAPAKPKPKYKYVKVMTGDNVISTTKVDNFNNNYIATQDSALFTEFYILGKKLYRNTGSSVSLLSNSDYVSCCANYPKDFDNAYNRALFCLADGNLQCYCPDAAANNQWGSVYKSSSTDKYIKVSGTPCFRWELALALIQHGNNTCEVMSVESGVSTANQSCTTTNFVYPSKQATGSQYTIDICGGVARPAFSRWGYILQANNAVYKFQPANQSWSSSAYPDSNISLLASNIKYISCRSNADNTFAGITTDNYWQINSTKRTDVKVKAITAGDGTYNYAIGYDDNALYYRPSGANSTITKLDATGNWTSLAQGVNSSYCMGIKDGKLYKLTGTTISQITAAGSGCIQIQGTDRYLLYCEE